MKRNRIIEIVLCVVIATLGLILGACSRDNDGYERLSAPQNLRVEDGALVWDKVEHASGYAVYIGNEENLTIEPRFDLSELTEVNTTYLLYVIAIGDGKHYSYSDEAEYSYTYTKHEAVPTPNLAYKLLPDGSGYEVSRGDADLKGLIVIPDYYEGLPVKRIADEGIWAFMATTTNTTIINNTWTTGVRLPDTLEEIGEKAFINCVALTEIDIPDSVTKIGIKAFECCEKLKRVKLPSGLKELPLGVFYDCK